MPNENALAVVVLAAGSGKRLNSNLPKVCHKLAGITLIRHVIKTVQKLDPDSISVVVGHEKEQVIQECEGLSVSILEQQEQKGTAHAANIAIEQLHGEAKVLILFGDVPLITHETLKKLLEISQNSSLGIVLANKSDPKGYGRIIRDDNNNIIGVVEQKDANKDQLAIKEIFTGILCVDCEKFKKWYPKINDDNAQHEYYLPDLIGFALDDDGSIASFSIEDEFEIAGVNTRVELAKIEKKYQQSVAEKFMYKGVSFSDYERVYFRGDVTIGKDSSIDFNVLLENTSIDENVTIGANCIIKNSTIKNGANIEPNTYIEGSTIGESCNIGPYARIRPDTVLHANVKIGNFVEVKKSEVYSKSKINHLSYIGDTVIMENVNIGAGTITCNFDGANKHQTMIYENAFIGSGTQLIAPVKIGKNSTIGAGSTITKDTPEDKLTLSRVNQTTDLAWQRPTKDKKSE